MRWLRDPSFWVSVLIVALAGAWPLVTGSASGREDMSLILMFVILASSLNIVLGYTGYVNFGHIVFFGLGGYIGFYLISQMGWHLIPAAIAGAIVTALFAAVLGAIILRLRGAYFALATIGVNEAVRALIVNWDALGGAVGMTMNFKRYQAYGGPMNALWVAYGLMIVVALLSVITSYGVRTSKFGLGLLAIREDEDAALVLGIAAPKAKTIAFVLSAIFPALAGALFFFKNGNIEPGDAFRLHMSVEGIVMIMLGGYGTVLGPIVGAATYERLRGYLLTSPIFKDLQLAFAGVLLLLIIIFVPSGLVGWLRNRFPKVRRVLA